MKSRRSLLGSCSSTPTSSPATFNGVSSISSMIDVFASISFNAGLSKSVLLMSSLESDVTLGIEGDWKPDRGQRHAPPQEIHDIPLSRYVRTKQPRAEHFAAVNQRRPKSQITNFLRQPVDHIKSTGDRNGQIHDRMYEPLGRLAEFADAGNDERYPEREPCRQEPCTEQQHWVVHRLHESERSQRHISDEERCQNTHCVQQRAGGQNVEKFHVGMKNQADILTHCAQRPEHQTAP